MKKEPKADGDGEPIRNIQSGVTKKGMHPNVFFSFAPPLCIDDPYQDPHTMVKKGKVEMLDPDAAFKPPGKIKRSINRLGYEYVDHKDSFKDPKEVREKYLDAIPPRNITS